MKAYWGSGGITPRIPDLITRWGEWSASLPGRFTRRKRAPGIHWIGGQIVPRARLDAVVKRELPIPYRETNPRSSSL
jgi:hypothetical protein